MLWLWLGELDAFVEWLVSLFAINSPRPLSLFLPTLQLCHIEKETAATRTTSTARYLTSVSTVSPIAVEDRWAFMTFQSHTHRRLMR